MDVHKESFSFAYTQLKPKRLLTTRGQKLITKKVLNYLEFLRTIYGDDANFICSYRGWLLRLYFVSPINGEQCKCIILAPTTMLEQRSKKRIKTDRRDAEIIAKCLAQHNYSPVHIPTAKDEEKQRIPAHEDDHKLALKK